MEGNLRVGSRFALAASPMLPETAAERSLKMSPNRLEATTTSKLWPSNEAHGSRIDEERFRFYIRKLGCDLLKGAIPKNHAEALRIGLGDGSYLSFLVPFSR